METAVGAQHSNNCYDRVISIVASDTAMYTPFIITIDSWGPGDEDVLLGLTKSGASTPCELLKTI